ncbi:MAG TPA: CbiX/SirB N-terminal domain-containing protein [bacterium]|jgi:sirohydrochlorin cobaltochelatase|nr:CbiX/SirB N-terminal domain-containing protein [bacterium]
MKKHVLVISHGSREISANADFKKLVQKYRRKHPNWIIAHAFLELAEPSIPDALENLAKKSDEIFILPLFLFAAKHVKKHIPEIIKTFHQQHPQVKIKLGKPLGPEPQLLNILDQRLKQIRPQ